MPSKRNCRWIGEYGRPAPLYHRVLCGECRSGLRADQVIALGIGAVRARSWTADRAADTLRALGLSPERASGVRMREIGRTSRMLRRTAWITVSILAVIGGWGLHLERDPSVAIPARTLPRPNAFEYYVQAGKMVCELEAVDTLSKDAQSTSTVVAPAPVQPKAAVVVAQNGPALAKLREGFRYRYGEPPARSFSHPLPHYAAFRSLARVLALEASVRADRGDARGAAASAIDAIQLGATCSDGGVLNGRLVGGDCEAIGRKAAQPIVHRLAAADARDAARRLQKIAMMRSPYDRTLEEEQWSIVGGLQGIMRKPGWRVGLGGLVGDSANQPAVFLASLRYSKADIVDMYMVHMASQRERETRAWSLRGPDPQDTATDPISSVLKPAYSRAGIKDRVNTIGTDMLAVALALRAYYCDHRSYPERISDLKPTYLDRVPLDPFQDSGTLLYQRLGARYVLYSVGPNGRGEGGGNATSKGTRGRTLDGFSAESQGDIVYGVNAP